MISQENGNIELALKTLINLTREVSRGEYSRAEDVFRLTKTGDYPEIIAELAESFGMMMVKLEGREFRLEQLISDLKDANKSLLQAQEDILARERDAILRLIKAAEFKDTDTGQHIFRVAHYSLHIARNMGLSKDEGERLVQISPMHDIGKVGIPDAILLKPGKLTTEEFDHMKCHTTIGYEILIGSVSEILRDAALVALHHHEKWDGSGYPHGKKGEDIPLSARISAVADVFDALTSERPYKKAWSMEQAVAQLKTGAGAHFDPRVVDAFLMNWDNVTRIRQKFQDS